ncbi:ATP-binding protein [Streptomyces sp. NPDC001728]|uniref:ATP-binding protein n=1 Tax=Streptomyces sp. NPDC001728 TaxID=3154396 RepID=UPI00332C2E5A
MSFTVEATEAAVHSARHRVSAAVRWWGVPVDEELCFNLELVTSELLTNGLLHTRGPMTAEVVLAYDLIVISVLDGSPKLPQLRSAQTDDECGRGLALIEDLCLTQGAETAPGGKRCWAVLPVRAAGDRAAEVALDEAQDNDSAADQARWSLSSTGRELLSSILPSS